HGATLQGRLEAREPMKPAEMVTQLRRIAQIQLQFEKEGLSTSPMRLDHVHLDGAGVLRMANLVVFGPRTPEQSQRDMIYLGRVLPPLVADGQRGTTRVLTLLSWMRGEGESELGEALSWRQVLDLCDRIDGQVSNDIHVQALPAEAAAQGSRQRPIGLMIGAGVLAFIVIILLAQRFGNRRPGPGVRIQLPAPVEVAAKAGVAGFRISAYEVTIGEYQEFLDTLNALEEAGGDRKVFDHKEQPASKASHEPDDWQNLLEAARKSKEWNGQWVTLDAPVVGVDWWDAVAYSEWKRGRLPEQQEWVAALGMPPDQVHKILCSPWGPINPEGSDRSALGVLNMAGSVCEWTRSPAPDPVNPLGAKKYVVIGGSYLQPQGHAMTRQWIDDRSLRRADLGFRVVFSTK
ncbi:MAG TPA: SUMF1/EgtB/PvdO family nonheme iron enzyme, partial [Luteolibacter sp.]|nr:SUMF1/EgtB/PvdO family nonheme iron enzyme [Luteolibacter sp.]